MSNSPAIALVEDEFAARIAALRHRVDGAVLVPGDPDYAGATRAWNLATDHHPAVVVVAEDVGDVVATVAFAAEVGLGLGVQATGHGAAADVDGVLLVTSRLREVAVDAEERRAWVAAGCTWADVLTATAPHGLVPVGGSMASVGAVGSTLGGGLGWLARRHGPACDAARSFEVVTPDGSLQRTCKDENPELFRALRGGGGGSLGVVTDMEIELVAATTVYAGNLVYGPDQAAELVERYAAWVADVPDELTSSIVLTNAATGPGVPDELQGRPAVVVRGCWSGDLEEGRELVDRWRRLAPARGDSWDEMPAADLGSIAGDPIAPVMRASTGAWMDRLDRAAADVLVAGVLERTDIAARVVAEVRHAGGAIATAERATSSLGHRDCPFLLLLVAERDEVVDGRAGRAAMDATREHLRATRDALALPGGTYLNALEGDERWRGAHTSIEAGDLDAIAELRRRLDPDDVLRFGVHHA